MRLMRDFILMNILSIFFYYVGFLKKAVHIENKQARIKNQPEL